MVIRGGLGGERRRKRFRRYSKWCRGVQGPIQNSAADLYREGDWQITTQIPASLTKMHFSPPSIILTKRSQQLNDLTIKTHIVAST